MPQAIRVEHAQHKQTRAGHEERQGLSKYRFDGRVAIVAVLGEAPEGARMRVLGRPTAGCREDRREIGFPFLNNMCLTMCVGSHISNRNFGRSPPIPPRTLRCASRLRIDVLTQEVI